MGTTFRFIEEPSTPSEVISWFQALPAPPREVQTERALVLYFEDLGGLVYDSAGRIDASASPVATVYLPRVRRGVLWTVGEVHFLPTPLRQKFPELHRVSARFSKWLSGRECVYSNKSKENPFSYYLEGSVKSYDPPVYAIESGLRAIKSQRYFVGEGDTESRIDDICRSLRLRGIECGET